MTDTLPRWRCHKVVQADKVMAVQIDTATGDKVGLRLECGAIVPLCYERGCLGTRIIAMPNSLVDGYYVRYEDGYESWSPAQAFEDGYTRIQDQDTRTCSVCVGTGKSGFIHPFACPSCNGTGRVPV